MPKIVHIPFPPVEFKPHISLAVFESIEVKAVSTLIENFARTIHRFNIHLSYPATFPTRGVVYLAPKTDPLLLNIHQRFHNELVSIGAESIDCYLPGF